MLIYKSDIPAKFLRYESARVVIVPAPYEKTTSYGQGAKDGPRGICEASSHIELYDEELGFEPYNIGIHTMESVGDSLSKLEDTVARVIADKKIPITLGGEHTISAAPVRACKRHFRNLSVCHFDAHADLRDTYKKTPLNHACVMRRIYETGAKFVQIGIRSHTIEEADFIKEKKLHRPFYAHEIHSSNEWMDKALALLTEDVYITFDVDAFDPSIMPATGTPEPGGLAWYQVTTFFKKLAASKNIVGADFVELAPRKGETCSDYTVARLIYKLIGYISV